MKKLQKIDAKQPKQDTYNIKLPKKHVKTTQILHRGRNMWHKSTMKRLKIIQMKRMVTKLRHKTFKRTKRYRFTKKRDKTFLKKTMIT